MIHYDTASKSNHLESNIYEIGRGGREFKVEIIYSVDTDKKMYNTMFLYRGKF